MLLLDMSRKADIKAAGRAVYVTRCEDRATYDAAFELFWRRRAGSLGAFDKRLPRLRQGSVQNINAPLNPDANETGDSVITTPVTIRAPSSTEQLRQTDFASLTPAEMRDAQAMLETLRPRLAKRPARRRSVGPHGRHLATRLMLRRALATGGESLRWRWLRHTERPRPIVLICDISGSMERYSRFLLRFAHTLARSGAPLEVFVFGTRLTRITRQLRVQSGDEALRRVADSVVDWSGGTRIGESLRELNLRWVRRAVSSSAVVLLISDGWERGDPELLSREMARLQRSCHRLVWLDPLASRAGFEPATLGLQAALPFVDEFLPCANITSLEKLGELLETI